MEGRRGRRVWRSNSQGFTIDEKRSGVLANSLQMPPICKLHATTQSVVDVVTKPGIPLGVGEFQISERQIGKGGGGEVYLGRCKPTKPGMKGEKVAIKVLEKRNVSAEVRAKKEVSVMHRLRSHPNIVKLLGAFESKTRIFLVMTYAPGGDLMEQIDREDRLHPCKAWLIFRQVVKALLYAHGKGIAHRDLKPENVFFDARGKVLLGDWGYACAWSSYKKKGRPCGSPQYAAPEILSCLQYTGPEVDMFSLGAVLYTMLTGKFPYSKETYSEMFDQVLAGKWNRDPALSASASDLLSMLLEPNPLRRATMYDVLRHDWMVRRPNSVRVIVEHSLLRRWYEENEPSLSDDDDSGLRDRTISSPLGGRKLNEDKCEVKTRKSKYF